MVQRVKLQSGKPLVENLNQILFQMMMIIFLLLGKQKRLIQFILCKR